MKKYLSIFIAMAALVIAGCEQIENNAPETNETNGTSMTFSAVIGADTKVDYTDGAAQLKWRKEGETITVFFWNDANIVVGTKTFSATTVSADGKSAKFTGDIPPGATKFRCVYPAIKATESAAEFTYDLTTQTGNYEESQTFMYTRDTGLNDEGNPKDAGAIKLVEGKPEKAVVFSHWTYIINATLKFEEGVEGTVSDIVFSANDKMTYKKIFMAKDNENNDVGSKDTNLNKKGDPIAISKTPTLVNGMTNVVVYGFGDNNIGDIQFTCKVNDKEYQGTLAGRGKNCQNGKQYTPVIEMRDVTPNPEQTELTFPFNFDNDDKSPSLPEVPTGWPLTNEKQQDPLECNYTLEGNTHLFKIYDDNTKSNKDGSGIYLRLNSGKSARFLALYPNTYLGLPIVEGKKLTKVECVTPTTSGDRIVGITAQVYKDTNEIEYVTGGKSVTHNSQSLNAIFNLTATEVNTMYYIASSGTTWAGINKLILTYE